MKILQNARAKRTHIPLSFPHAWCADFVPLQNFCSFPESSAVSLTVLQCCCQRGKYVRGRAHGRVSVSSRGCEIIIPSTSSHSSIFINRFVYLFAHVQKSWSKEVSEGSQPGLEFITYSSDPQVFVLNNSCPHPYPHPLTSMAVTCFGTPQID